MNVNGTILQIKREKSLQVTQHKVKRNQKLDYKSKGKVSTNDSVAQTLTIIRGILPNKIRAMIFGFYMDST